MKAVIAIISDDHVGARIPDFELRKHFPFLDRDVQGICPFFSRQHPFHHLFNLIGETLNVLPGGDIEPFGNGLGFPARFTGVPSILNLFADIPRSGIVLLCPNRCRQKIPLTSVMNFRPPITFGDVCVKSYRIYRGADNFLFSGFVHKNGKSAYLLVGNDREAPVLIGRGFKGDNLVAILVYGINNLEKAKKELKRQFSVFHLQEATKADIEKLTHASTATSSRHNTSTYRSNTESSSRDGNGS